MKKAIVLINVIFLVGCFTRDVRDNIIPYENGINEVSFTDKNNDQMIPKSLKWAREYCDDMNQDFKVIEREKKYDTSLVNDTAKKNIDVGIKIIEFISRPIGVKIPDLEGVSTAITGSGEITQNLLFRCVDRKTNRQ